jgi:hypothetical protein
LSKPLAYFATYALSYSPSVTSTLAQARRRAMSVDGLIGSHQSAFDWAG